MKNWYKIADYTEWVSLNIFSVSIIGWIQSLTSVVSGAVAVLVGISVIALNCVKFYGVYLENQKKKTEIYGKQNIDK